MKSSKNQFDPDPTAPRCTVVLIAALFTLQLAMSPVAASTATTPPPAFAAKWIWLKGADVHAYNQTIAAEKKFKLDKPQQAGLRNETHGQYRVIVNGKPWE